MRTGSGRAHTRTSGRRLAIGLCDGRLMVMGFLRGRQAQGEALRAQLDALRAGRGGTVLVAGLAGMGKTVLLDATEVMAREHGIKVFRGGGDAAGRVIPFGPLLEALVSASDAPVDPVVLRDLS